MSVIKIIKKSLVYTHLFDHFCVCGHCVLLIQVNEDEKEALTGNE
jgi:hypothetical protein